MRDKIPEIIETAGQNCHIRVLHDPEYCLELKRKLLEEVNEFLAETNLEELADIVEVVYSLAKAMGHNDSQLEELRCKKV